MNYVAQMRMRWRLVKTGKITTTTAAAATTVATRIVRKLCPIRLCPITPESRQPKRTEKILPRNAMQVPTRGS